MCFAMAVVVAVQVAAVVAVTAVVSVAAVMTVVVVRWGTIKIYLVKKHLHG